MTLVATKGSLTFPNILPSAIGSTPSFSAITAITLAGSKYAIVFQASKTASIDKVVVRFATVTTPPTTCDVRIETMDLTTGQPTGTLVGTNTNVSVAPTTNGNFELTLTSSASLTRGTYYAIVIAPTGTFNFAYASILSDDSDGMPAFMSFNGTTWTSLTGTPPAAIKYTDGSIDSFNKMAAFTGSTTQTFSSTTNPNHRGTKLTMPFKVKAIGAYLWIDLDGDTDVKLFDTDGVTVLATAKSYTNIPLQAGAAAQRVIFNNEVTLNAGGTYFLAVAPTTATNLSTYMFNYFDSTYNPWNGEARYVTANNPTGVGSWTETAASVPFMGLMISAVDDGAAGGGAVTTINAYFG